MINDENLDKLYSELLSGIELTTNQLNSFGFNSKDLKNLIEMGIIIRVKRGLYSLKSADELFCYGKKLVAERDFDKANLFFEKCFELNPNNLGACFQLFLRSIENQDYKRTFELYEILSKSKNCFYIQDYNYYLYLLSIIIDIPDKYKEQVKRFTLQDIKVLKNDKRYQDISLHNEIRQAVLQRKLVFAMKQLNILIKKQHNLTAYVILSRTLLYRALTEQNKSKKMVNDLIKQKNYSKIVDYLSDKQSKHNLSITESYILKLAKQYIDIELSKRVPDIIVSKIETAYDAIDCNDFNVALTLSTDYNNANNIASLSNPINLLLKDICSLINSLNKDIIMEDVSSTEKIEITIEQENSNNQLETSLLFSSILSSLMQNDVDNAVICLKKYLGIIKKDKYTFLIIDLIGIDLLEKDVLFTKSMIVLSLVSRDNYVFDSSQFLQEFYLCLMQKKYKQARKYLDILAQAHQFGQECKMIDSLYQALEVSEKPIELKQSSIIPESSNEIIEENKQQSTQLEEASINLPDSDVSISFIKSEQKSHQQQDISEERINREKEFIAAKHDELVKNSGIILLDPMDEYKIERLLNLLKDYSDIDTFTIDNGKRQIVLRYTPDIERDIDKSDLVSRGSQAYRDENYDECIKVHLQLLQLFKHPKAITYSRLGLAYMKKNNIPLAISYLTVANFLAKQEQTDLDFSDLLLRLKNEIPREQMKPKFKMDVRDFDYSDVTDYYTINNFDEIHLFILNSGLDVETACSQLGMTIEQTDIVKLIYAREFYIQGNHDRGNLFLKSYERSKNKTEMSLKLFNDIIKNKKFYQNRKPEKIRQLSLTIIPKKN